MSITARQLYQSIASARVAVAEFPSSQYHDTVAAVQTVRWAELPSDVQKLMSDFATKHPYQTAFIICNGFIILTPGVVTGPLLGLAGFTSLGPAAGKEHRCINMPTRRH